MIWIQFMTQVLSQLPTLPFEIPDDIVFVQIDPATGLLAPDHANHGTVEIFAKGTEPTQAPTPRIDPTEFYRLDEPRELVAPATSPSP